MHQKPLSERELEVLARVERKLLRGRMRMGLLGLLIGACGGLLWVVIMWAAAPGFGSNIRVTPPTGREAHALLEETFYWLAVHFGPVAAICLLAAGMFGALGGGLAFGLAWRLMVMNHANLAAREVACGQFEPKYQSAQLRRLLAAKGLQKGRSP